MARTDSLEYECDDCGLRDRPEDALVTTCPRCGGEMRDVSRIDP